jgi:hypothetical protein
MTPVKTSRDANGTGDNCHAVLRVGLDNCHDRCSVPTVPRTNYYTTPTKPPLTRWARHIDAWMRANGQSPTGAARVLGAAVGLGPNSRSGFLPYLYKKEPNEEQAKALAAIIGWPPEAAPEPTTATETVDPTAALITAMTGALLAQTQALTELRADLVEARDAAKSEREAMTKMLARLEARLAELPLPGGTGSAAADQALAQT